MTYFKILCVKKKSRVATIKISTLFIQIFCIHFYDSNIFYTQRTHFEHKIFEWTEQLMMGKVDEFSIVPRKVVFDSENPKKMLIKHVVLRR